VSAHNPDSNNRPLEVPTWASVRHNHVKPGPLYRHPRRGPVSEEGPTGGGRWSSGLPDLDEQESVDSRSDIDDETREGWW
jgi:hypothetical protein